MSARRRAAISPVLATLLLIVIAVVAGILVYAWMSGWLKWQMFQAGVQLKIDDVTVRDGRVHITVRNMGSSVAVVDKVFIEDIEYDASAKVQPGDYVELSFPYAWTYGGAIYVKVVTDTGQWTEWRNPIRVPETPFAIEFNGPEEQAYTGDADDLDLTTFTIECWIKITKADTERWTPIMVKGEGSFWGSCNYGLCLYRRDPEQIEVIYWGEDNRLHYSPARIPGLNQWFHLVGLFDGSSLKIYINGELKHEEPTTALPQINDKPLYMGYNNYYELFNYFIIDELRIYNRPLSGDEIRDNIRGKIAMDGLVLWYRFDEGSGTSVRDVSGAGHTANFGPTPPSWTDGVEKEDVEDIIGGAPLLAQVAMPIRREA